MNTALVTAILGLDRASGPSEAVTFDVPAFDPDLFTIKLDDKATWKPTAVEGWQGPLRKAAPFVVGNRFTFGDAERHANGAPVAKRNKFARRMLRGKIMGNRTSIKKQINESHRAVAKAGKLADNPHEKQRLLDEESAVRLADFNERLAKWTWFRDWCAAWRDIGNAYGRLTVFARMGVK